jgi:hypothetical protein
MIRGQCVCLYVCVCFILQPILSMHQRIKRIESQQADSVYQNFCIRGCIQVCLNHNTATSCCNHTHPVASDHVRSRPAARMQRALVGSIHVRRCNRSGAYGGARNAGFLSAIALFFALCCATGM